MKFTRKTLIETLRRKNDGWTTYQVRKIASVSVRRVNQVWDEYQKTGQIPEIGKKAGRPSRQILPKEEIIVKESYLKYRVSASTLEKVIKRDYFLHIPHNHIHKILVKLDYAKHLKIKHIRKKDWIRYERRHSLTAVHIDWHFNAKKRIWVFAVIDDASRKLLALIECSSPTTDASIRGMKLALKYGKIKQCISDHGSQFTDNRDGKSRFVKFLKKHGIKQILCRIKHPQSNGKVEKWFHLYDVHRWNFKNKEEFVHWYNKIRPHKALKFEILETPNVAFIRKMKAEA